MKKCIKHHQKRMAFIAKLTTAMKGTGFVECEFNGEDEVCDLCDRELTKSDKVYYRRTCYEVEEGEYFCNHCVVAEHESNLAMGDYYAEIMKKAAA